jgi:adenylate kinase family enzyme
MQLAELGARICILGPSNSGKSTLATAIGRKLELDVVHLDQLYHIPHSDWQPRPAEEFRALHDAAINAQRWVMDGNYSACMPQRFERATGVILLDVSMPIRLFRYMRRTLVEGNRRGALEGGRDRLRWHMIHYIVMTAPAHRRRYADIYRQISLPKQCLSSLRAIRSCYEGWGLER